MTLASDIEAAGAGGLNTELELRVDNLAVEVGATAGRVDEVIAAVGGNWGPATDEVERTVVFEAPDDMVLLGIMAAGDTAISTGTVTAELHSVAITDGTLTVTDLLASGAGVSAVHSSSTTAGSTETTGSTSERHVLRRGVLYRLRVTAATVNHNWASGCVLVESFPRRV